MAKNRLNQKKSIQNNLKEMPNAFFFNFNDKSIFLKSLNKNGICIVYFNPDCEHCQYETSEIIAKLDRFKENTMVFVSAGDKEQTYKFGTKYKLIDKKNIYLLIDKSKSFYDFFGTLRVPTIFVYNKQSYLISRFDGEVKIEKVIDVI